MPPDASASAAPRWIGPEGPQLRLEAHFGDRVVACFPDRPQSLYALLAEAVARRPDGEAVVCEETRLTYGDLARAVETLSAALAAQGVAAGDRVAMLIGNRTEFVTVLFALARLGAIAVPMGLRLQTPEIAHVLADCGARPPDPRGRPRRPPAAAGRGPGSRPAASPWAAPLEGAETLEAVMARHARGPGCLPWRRSPRRTPRSSSTPRARPAGRRAPCSPTSASSIPRWSTSTAWG
jgi:hypothetical protein